ncbi:MAG TPA: acyltransferase, partial [Holophaga sp.]|nr:acyltransferase [Holophaga sp.]
EQGTRLSNITNVFGPYGVEGFFMVSGFCFFLLYGETSWSGRNLATFHIKRFFRIAPLYYAALLFTLLFKPPFGTSYACGQPTLRLLAENFSFTFAFFQPDRSVLMGGWSIGLEYLFYFALPLLLWGTRRKVLLYAGLVALLAWAWHWNFVEVPGAPLAGDMKLHTYVLVRNHAFLFVLGGVVAHLRSLAAWRLRLPVFLILVLGIIFLAIPKGTPVYDTFVFIMGWERAWYVTLCFLMVMTFAFYDPPAHPLRAPFVLLGDLSYSLYLLHPIAYLITLWAVPQALPPLVRFSIALAATFLLSYVVYRWLEKPAMALGKHIAARV